MLKRLVLFVFVLSTLALLAMAPTHGSQVSENTHKLQATIEVTVVVATPGTDATPASGIPVTGGMPMSTLIIFGLLAILGLAILIGGAALLNSRR